MDLAVIKNKSVFIKHVRSNGTGSVFKGKCMWLVSKDCSYRRIDKEIGKSVQAFKSKTVITLGFAFTYRNTECRMAADGKIHSFRIIINYFPAYFQVVLLQSVGDLQSESKRINLQGFFRGLKDKGKGSIGDIRADKIAVSCKAVLAGRIFLSVQTPDIFVVTSHVGKKYRRMAFPVSRICLPEDLPVISLVIDAGEFSTVIGNGNLKKAIFNRSCHDKPPV